MRRLGLVLFAAAAFAVPAAQADAAKAPKTPTLAQFTALQKQVKTLQTQVKNLTTAIELTQVGTLGILVCQTAVIADEFQATWNVIDQISTATQAGKTYFGAQAPLSDLGACGAFQVARPTLVPPTTAIFSSLITLLTS